MGERGPVRKRSDQRVRRNKDAIETEKVTAIGAVPIPELGFDDPHPIVRDLYRSLTESAQRRYYEPSDWQYARTALHFLDGLLKSPKPNGQLLTTVNSMLSSLLVSEGDRRRVQLEIERKEAEGVVVDVAQIFRDRLAQG
ncbi:minor tail protein [Mycobacterium phage Kalnoky]|uniref:Minor tail protein n=1 Tax=Mycobacterium phage PurpleHaze TaxID=1983577 RepID=A0A220NRR7_9CAUD|nr:minor tail protein [Mycobacterium phage Purple Haze]AVJ50750.1 terminase small subunit [Mycobacterium phage OlanP]AXC35111.1 minor tail protein [Mycobacterium phage Phranny]AXH44052.1 minor tail protein [Mycobacterium phage Kalnoky]AXH44460.1 minor tail protein [Mycobacterium phage Marius]AXH44633.1 terminase small subunit [Mycobacterium phage PhishRPhriends]AXH44782.1 minor tail protein [Mycobacterium phage Reba]AZF96774.1 minor tail protein [Mycobacterium Phage Kalb97]AZV00494.1 hypoth